MESKKSILIVEDDDFLRSLVDRRLTGDGYEVLIAKDGNSGFEMALKKIPKVILLDLLLPGVSGYEVLEKIRAKEETKDIPIIIFSNLGQKEDVKKAMQLGANDFLIKANFTLDDLVEKIKVYFV